MESCLDTLSDVVNDYLVRMTQLLRAAVDNNALRMEEGAGGFSVSLDVVFYCLLFVVIESLRKCQVVNEVVSVEC